MSSASIVTPALLLRSTPFGESDLVVTLLGRSTGRLSALAKGARKSQRRFGGGLGLGALGEASLKDRSGGELLWLDSFDVVESRVGLGADLGRTAHAAYALELCDRLCAPRHPEPETFDWLERFLRQIEAEPPSAERLRVFELGLLRRLGIAPVLDSCARCGRTDLDDGPVRWLPGQGGVFCRDCARQGSLLAPDAWRALVTLARLSLEDAPRAPLPKDVNAGCREAILELLRSHIPTPLKSVAFIGKLGA